MTDVAIRSEPARRDRAIPLAVGLLACLVWSYWPTLVELNQFWSRNDDYSCGRLVPFVALYFIWRDRARFAELSLRPNWWGLFIVLLAQGVRFCGVYFYFASAERFSMVLTVVGLVLLVGGRLVFQRAKWVLLFLFLTVPPPNRIHEMVTLPLQGLSTSMAAFTLELLGFFVYREGNVLRINDVDMVAVTEACSGLRMLTAFIFVAGVVAFVLDRPAWQKTALILSSVPVAVFTNAVRLVATSLFVVYSSDPNAEQYFHDYAGLAMMPVAFVLLIAELRLLSALVHEDVPHTRAPKPRVAG